MSTSSDIRFYHLTASPLEQALPKLLEKAIASGFRAVVHTSTTSEMEQLNTVLWTYDPASFLAHGCKNDPHKSDHPVYLTTEHENPNGANLLVVTSGQLIENAPAFERILDVFNGSKKEEVEAARQRWKHYKEQGSELQYWQQNEMGSWQQAA